MSGGVEVSNKGKFLPCEFRYSLSDGLYNYI